MVSKRLSVSSYAVKRVYDLMEKQRQGPKDQKKGLALRAGFSDVKRAVRHYNRGARE